LQQDDMMKIMGKIFGLLLILAMLCSDAPAHEESFLHFNRRQTLVGTIQRMERNTLFILDEEDKRIKRLVYLLDSGQQFHPGDRVRIYYQTPNSVIETIKKMRPLEYKKEAQNLGIIYTSH
jgi:hypothetical protein